MAKRSLFAITQNLAVYEMTLKKRRGIHLFSESERKRSDLSDVF